MKKKKLLIVLLAGLIVIAVRNLWLTTFTS